LRSIAVGLALGLLLIAWERSQRRGLRSIAHPSATIPTGDTSAARLAGHVVRLSRTIGERNVFQPKALESAARYIESEFAESGFQPTAIRYPAEWAGYGPIETRDIVATIPGADAKAPVLVIGAHYDSAPGTPGADDNASGVAALLELARRFRDYRGTAEIRLVAFSTEEPPFFGTAKMGSAHYAAALADEKREVLGMISLEMLGYYSNEPKSQNYPPVLGLFYPSRGNYIGFISNLSSHGFLKRLESGFHSARGLPKVAASLPEWIREITLSDQLYFWRRGWDAAMISDTAFLRNPNYHEATDVPETLDFERFADAVDGLEGAIRAVAGPK
jgi:hypothetical protein